MADLLITSGVPEVTMVMRDRCVSCATSATVRLSMLNERAVNRPTTRASTPGSLSTSTESVWHSMSDLPRGAE